MIPHFTHCRPNLNAHCARVQTLCNGRACSPILLPKRVKIWALIPRIFPKLLSNREWSNCSGSVCDVRWTWSRDPVLHSYAAGKQQDGDMHAVMVHGEALVDSQMVPGQTILIRDQLSLWNDRLWIHDRGFHPHTGAFIYGNQLGSRTNCNVWRAYWNHHYRHSSGHHPNVT